MALVFCLFESEEKEKNPSGPQSKNSSVADYKTANNGSVEVLDVTIMKEIHVTFLQM